MPKYPLKRKIGRLTQEFERSANNKLSTMVATRQNVNPWLSVYDALPNPDPVLRRSSSRIEILNEVKREPHVSATTKSRKSGVKKRLWKIERGNASALSAEIIESAFKNIKADETNGKGIRTIIGQILDGWGYGYKPLEILWRREGNLYLPFVVEGKPPEWFEFGRENELRLKQKDNFKSEPVQPYKFLLAQYEADYNNPYGEAQYSLAFWPTTFKKGGIKFWAQFLESFGMPHAIGKYPRNAEKADREKLLTALTLLIQNAAATIPDDASVELLEVKAGSTSSDLYERHARYHDGEISKCILGHGAAADSTPGKLGGDDPAMNVRSDIIEDDSTMVEECFDQLIRYIHELNPTLGTERPRFVLYDEEDVDAARADRDYKLMNSNRVILKKQYFTRRYDFLEDEIEVDESFARTDARPSVSTRPGVSKKAEFAAGKDARPSVSTGQNEIDSLTDAVTDEAMQQQAEALLKPVLDLINNADSYNDVKEKLLALKPELDSGAVEKTVEKLTLLATLQGRQPEEVAD